MDSNRRRVPGLEGRTLVHHGVHLAPPLRAPQRSDRRGAFFLGSMAHGVDSDPLSGREPVSHQVPARADVQGQPGRSGLP